MSDRYSYEPRQIRASALAPDDVMLHRRSWRRVGHVWVNGLSEEVLKEGGFVGSAKDMVHKYLLAPGQWVLVGLRFEKRNGRTAATRLIPIRTCDLVTVQSAAEVVPSPAEMKVFGPQPRKEW